MRFLAGEYGCPVIVEYKRHNNENVINQGLFYLDWHSVGLYCRRF